MGSEFYTNFDIVKKYSNVDEKLGYPISKIILRPEKDLQLTKKLTSNLNSKLFNFQSSQK